MTPEPSTPATAALGSLWAGVLLAPLAALGGLELGYALVEPACATGRMLPLHASFLGCLVLALASAALGWRAWRRSTMERSAAASPRALRNTFLALLGIGSGMIFALVIVAQWSASLYLHPCG